jgi:methenyltetrahydrofolate cyclohydrolase
VSDADRGAARRLIQLTVGEFVDAVAATDPPLPAGGSVAALSGAQSAALLALVCGVLQHRGAGSFEAELGRLDRLQRDLLELVDEDAEAYEQFLHARRSGGDRLAAIERMTRTPLAIGWASADVIELSEIVDQHDVRLMRGDVRAARHLAEAALRTSLDLAEANIDMQKEPAAREALVQAIGRLRERLA